MIGIFLIASASATDLNETTVLDIDDSDIDGTIAISNIEDNRGDFSSFDNKLDVSESEILSNNFTPQSYGDIQSVINNANDGDTIILDGSYVATPSDVGVIVNKSVNFIGINNAVVDGKSKIRLFEIESKNDVTFKNIKFINGNADSGSGGAIYGECAVINCIFENNSAGEGGAISQGSSAVNCSFINNHAQAEGGAIKKSYSPGLVAFRAFNCTFINNSADYGGGAINVFRSCGVERCIFINNYAQTYGGAIQGGSAKNCSFVNNSANIKGGAIMDVYAVNSSFVNNSAQSGGAAAGSTSDNCAVNCSFVNNSAHSGGHGGAMNGGSAVNCSFVNNSAIYGGAMGSGSAVNCSFVNNTAQLGGATSNSNVKNCSFVDNSAFDRSYGGGAMYSGSAVSSIFISNHAENGGALWNANAKNCTFINNTAHFDGGAMKYDSAVNCSFVNNSANSGGAIYDTDALDCTFVNNSANSGGAVATQKQEHYSIYENTKVININGCCFINNSAKSSGGAIESSHGYRTYNITECTFFNNSAGNGGAVNLLNRNFNLNNCTFDNNSANKGGALYIANEGNVTACNFTNSHSTNQGGAIYLTNANLNLTLSNFTNCSSDDGSSYLESDNPSLYNIFDCIFDEAPKGVSYYYHTILTVNNLFIAKGQKGMLYANLSNILGPLVNKKVNFIFNGMKFYSVTDSEGIAEFNVNNYLTSFGETIVDLSFTGDDINYPSYANSSVYINRYHGNLTVSVDGEFYNDTFLVFKLVNSVTNVPISDAQLRLNFSNGEIFNITTDFDGCAVFNIPFAPYTYDVFAYVDEDYVNVNNVSVNSIVIKKLVGEIDVIPLNDNHTLMIRLFNPDDQSAIYRNVKINLDVGPNPIVKEELFTNENGYVMYDLLNFTKGTYSISVTVKGDYKDFYDYRLSDYVISNLLDSKVNFTNDISFDFGEYGSTNFTVYGGKIELDHISVINHPEALIAITKNVINVFGLSVGNYVLLVETTPDEYHNAVNATLNITVNNVKSKVTLKTGVVFEYGGSASIHVTVDGGTVERKNIRVLNHPEAKITLSSDVITISGLNVGSYVLSVTSTPDSDHTAATGTVTVTVKKAVAVVTEFKRTVALKKGSSGALKFVDSRTKKPIKGMQVTLKVYTGKKFKTMNLKTNSKGEVSYQTKGLAKGNHKIVVSASHSGYRFSQVKFTINVVKPIVLKFKLKKNDPTKRGTLVSFQVLNKKTKKGVNGVKVRFLIKTGKKYKIITMKTKKVGKFKGIAGFFTNQISAGKHLVKIEPVSIKYSGSGQTKMVIRKSAKNYAKKTTTV